MPIRPEPTPAIVRFRASMVLDYDAWKDGTPYDIDALAGITPEERDALVEDICSSNKLDWRDVEALRALDTPKARARIKQAADDQTDGGGAEAFREETGEKWTAASEKRLLAKLSHAALMESSLDRLLEIAEQHPTPAVRKHLWKLATTGERDTRYTYGAFLLYLAGHVEDWYGWDEGARPHLLDITHETGEKQAAAIAWLKEKIDHPKK